MLQGVDARGGQHPGLTHPAPQQFPLLPAGSDPLRPAAEKGPRRCPQTLGKAEHHRVHRAAEFPGLHPQRRGGVKEPGPVHVDQRPPLMGRFRHLRQPLRRCAAAAGKIVGVLHADHFGPGLLQLVPDIRHVRHVVPVQPVEHRLQPQKLGVEGHLLRDIHVQQRVDEHPVPRPAGGGKGGGVGHGAGGEEKGVLLAGEVRRQLLQPVHGGVPAGAVGPPPPVVSQPGPKGGLQHLPAGHGHRVTSQVDHGGTSFRCGVVAG